MLHNSFINILGGASLVLGNNPEGTTEVNSDPGIPLRNQVTATHLKIGHLQISSAGARSSNELRWLDLKLRHLINNPSYVHMGDMSYFVSSYGKVQLLFLLQATVSLCIEKRGPGIQPYHADAILSSHEDACRQPQIWQIPGLHGCFTTPPP